VEGALELLGQQRPQQPGDADLRGFEWHYLWRLAHRDLRTLRGHTDKVVCVRYSPNGKQLASASDDGTVKLWDVTTGRLLHTL
jgi:WD40 repeat protein